MTASPLPDRRMLLVHAHPDDETIGNGVTMAKYVAEGAHVTLLTCTLGEEGEVLVPELEHLSAQHDDGLGEHRIGELADAMGILGVTDHRFLGGPGHYRDTGMDVDEKGNAIPPAKIRDDAFWAADLTEASAHVVAVIREIRPQVLLTYDENGGYGHPDHIQAHRVAMYGAVLAAAPGYRTDLGEPWEVPKIYWNAMSEERMREGLRKLRDMGDTTTFEGMDPDGDLPSFVTPDKLITAVIEGLDHIDQKLDAMRAHATQITVDGPFFALSNNIGNEVWGIESYRLVRGTPAPSPDSPTGQESDLFAGVA